MGNAVRKYGVRPKTTSEMAHVKLKRIYDERIGHRMTQAEFGHRYGIGSQTGVALYLNGGKPLGIEAAAKFAEGLGCTVGDFAPELEARFVENVVPFLGKTVRRAAMIVLSIPAISSLMPSDAQATPRVSAAEAVYYVKRWLRLLRQVCSKLQNRGILRERYLIDPLILVRES